MNDLKTLSKTELSGALKLTHYLADLMQDSNSNFSEVADDPELDQAEESARQFNKRRGRIYTDDSEEGIQIREQVKKYLSRTKQKQVGR